MNALLVLIVVSQLLIAGLLFWKISHDKRQETDVSNGYLSFKSDLLNVERQIGENFRHLQTLEEMKANRLDESLSRTNKSFVSMAEKVSALGEATKQMQVIGRDITGLHSLLAAPKLRGNLGEYLLIDLLKEHLPEKLFEVQKKLNSGVMVDSVVKLKSDLFVCIDAKFPLENFRKIIESGISEDELMRREKVFIRDVKKHINDISSKYIVPDEGSLDFAFMYVPAEGVYQEILKQLDSGLLEYAIEKRVFMVSPTSLFAYLQTVLLGLKGMEVQEKAKKIVEFVSTISKDSKNLLTEMEVLSGHLNSSSKKLQNVKSGLGKINEKIENFVEIKG